MATLIIVICTLLLAGLMLFGLSLFHLAHADQTP